MNTFQVLYVVVMGALGFRALFAAWCGDPPAHVAIGSMALITMAVTVANGSAFVAAVSGLVAGWQFGCAYMRRVGQPHVVAIRGRFYLDEDTGRWERTDPVQHGESD